MKNKNIALLLISLSTFILSANASPKTFLIDDDQGRDIVTFTSDAPIEVIKGSTKSIKGTVVIDDSLDLKKVNPSVVFEVSLDDIDTGIPLRNEHMRDNFLETTKFPKAKFEVEKIKPKNGSELKDGEKKELIAEGTFTLHGHSVKKEIPVTVTYLKASSATQSRFPKGDVIRIQSTFPVMLAEHNINRPKAVFYKLADVVFISIDVFANAR